jgi:hypothetical protein
MTPTSLVDREIETKITAAIKAEVEKGKQPSDMGRREFLTIAHDLRASFSPAARETMARKGLEIVVRQVFGEIIAERIWEAGEGWPADADDLARFAHGFKFDGDDSARSCFELFRENLPELTLADMREYCSTKLVNRYQGLFDGQPIDATLGEVATKKAADGDPLAHSFLTWRPATAT